MTSRLARMTRLMVRRNDFSLRCCGQYRRGRYLKCEWPGDGQSVDMVGSFLAVMKLFACGNV